MNELASSVDTLEIRAPSANKTSVSETGSSGVQVDLGAVSHPGKVRPNNEDHFLITKLERSMQVLLSNLPEGLVPDRQTETAYGILVADGMGGHAAGEVASKEAIRFMVELVLATPDWIMRNSAEGTKEVIRRTEDRFQQITQSLTQMTHDNPRLFGMGTTMTLACSLGSHMIVSHVGDSRAYRFRNGRLERVTHDHTLVQALIDKGAMLAEDAAKHPLRHVLLNVIGTKGEPVKVEIDQVRLADGDQILLCSDGLTDMVPEPAIAQVLGESRSAEDACHVLVDLALEAGGKDNVTVALGHYHIPE